jgi:4'-phosphopantetheinyl transferase
VNRVEVLRFDCSGAPLDAVSAEERAAAARFADESLQRRYLQQRGAVRHLLAQRIGVTPAGLRFARSPRGKPRLIDGGGVEFSLSHSGDECLLAIARGFAVGVDLESVHADLDVAVLAPLVLAREEAAAAASKRAFLRIWCRKEACLKATGEGLLDDLTSLSVAGDRAGAACVQDLDAGDGYVAAVAALAPFTTEPSPARTTRWR